MRSDCRHSRRQRRRRQDLPQLRAGTGDWPIATCTPLLEVQQGVLFMAGLVVWCGARAQRQGCRKRQQRDEPHDCSRQCTQRWSDGCGCARPGRLHGRRGFEGLGTKLWCSEYTAFAYRSGRSTQRPRNTLTLALPTTKPWFRDPTPGLPPSQASIHAVMGQPRRSCIPPWPPSRRSGVSRRPPLPPPAAAGGGRQRPCRG